MQITSNMELDEHTQGIQDSFGKQEIEANKLGKQIFLKYGYVPIKIHNHNDELFKGTSLEEGTDHGIDDVIYLVDIPINDPLKLKSLSQGRFDDMCYSIDYKSNNFVGDINSVYVKIMQYTHKSNYSKEFIRDGEKVNPEEYYIKKDQKVCKLAIERGEKNVDSFTEKRYHNKFLLANSNKTDYFLYLKYDKGDIFNLKQAYLIQANILRNQIIDILNRILKIGDSENRICFDDPYLNYKIIEALLISKDHSCKPFNNELELFLSGKDIMVRIPETLLDSYIKFDNDGLIVNSVAV